MSVRVSKGMQFIREVETCQIKKKHEAGILKSMRKYGKYVQGKLRNVIQTGSRTGRVYIIRGKRHTASAPGEPPANLSGRLATGHKYKANPKELVVYNNVRYAEFLEQGTSRMQPRPWFEKTNVDNADILERYLFNVLSV